MQLHVDENECRMKSYLYAYANAYAVILVCSCMHAILVGPPIALLYFLLHGVISPALYKGLHAAEARPVQMGGCREGPDSRAFTGRTCGDAQYSMSFAIVCHLQSPYGLRQVW